MKEQLPTVTVIIPARPGNSEVPAAAAARRMDYPAELLEVLVVRGQQPSVQRNMALRQAAGELIYFLDDDSIPEKDALRRGTELFKDTAVQIIGGPNLCPPESPVLEQIFAWTMASWVAFGPSRAR